MPIETMKAVIFEHQGASPEIRDIDVPEPSPDQILVKSIYYAVNPVDAMIPATGILVEKWPIGLGADASGIVVEVGKNAAEKHGFKIGDRVWGCVTRCATLEYQPCNEYFVMDAALTMRMPGNVSFAGASTCSSPYQSSALSLFDGLKLAIPDAKAPAPADRDEWILIMGGSGSVGGAGVSLARAAGYKVISSSSPKNFEKVKQYGAKVVFDYSAPLEEQINTVHEATGGKLGLIYDATSQEDPKLAKEIFKTTSAITKLFATTNSWSGLVDFEGGRTYVLTLGIIGREYAKEVNDAVKRYNPVLEGLFASGRVKTQEYEEVGSGLEAAIKAMSYKGDGRKVVVRIQDE